MNLKFLRGRRSRCRLPLLLLLLQCLLQRCLLGQFSPLPFHLLPMLLNFKEYVHSVLASMLSQPGSQDNFGSNPFLSAPVEVPDIPSQGSTGGRGSESLIRGRFASPSGVVPPPSEDDVMPPINVFVPCSVVSSRLDSFSGSPFPSLGDSSPFTLQPDQLRDRGDLGLTQHVIAADIHHVPRSLSSFDPTSLLFPFSDSGFSSLPPPPPSSALPAFSSLSSTAPSSTVPLLPLLLLLFLFSRFPLLSLLFFLLLLFLLPLSRLPFPPFLFFPLRCLLLLFPLSRLLIRPLLPWSLLPLLPGSLRSLILLLLLPLFLRLSPRFLFPLLWVILRLFKLVLGLSDEYQALGRWFFTSGGSNFPSYLSSHFPHLYSDFRLNFSSGSSRFLAALPASPPLPPPSSAPLSSAFLPPSAPLLPHPPGSSLPPAVSSSLPFSWRPLVPGAPSASSFPSAPSLSSSVAPVVSAPPSFPFSLGDRRPLAPGGSLGGSLFFRGCCCSGGSCVL